MDEEALRVGSVRGCGREEALLYWRSALSRLFTIPRACLRERMIAIYKDKHPPVRPDIFPDLLWKIKTLHKAAVSRTC